MQNRNDTFKFFGGLLALLFATHQAVAQGTFRNLDFESANVSGYAPASMIPISSGFPGWSATANGSSLSQVWYDNVALGSGLVAINDKNLGGGSGPGPIQGNYSAYIAGGNGTAFTLEQTGVVPTGTESLLMDVQTTYFGLQTTLGGNTVSMVPLYSTSSYTVYGGNISAYAGQTEQLAFTESAAPGIGYATIDDIQFSASPIPEPGTWTLLLFGAGLLGVARCASRKFQV